MWRELLQKVADTVARRVTILRSYPILGQPNGTVETKPYLYRYYLFRSRLLGSLFLHKIVGSDNGPEIHNHPWHFSCALLLAGGYTEERMVGALMREQAVNRRVPVTRLRRLVAPALNIITWEDFHRLQLEPGTEVWTLFYHTPTRVQNWGFLYPNGEFHPVLQRAHDGADTIDPKSSSGDDE